MLVDATQDLVSERPEALQDTNASYVNAQSTFIEERPGQDGAVSASEWHHVADLLSDESRSPVPLVQWTETENKKSSSCGRDLNMPGPQQATHLSASYSNKKLVDATQYSVSEGPKALQDTNGSYVNSQSAFIQEAPGRDGAVSASEWQYVADLLSEGTAAESKKSSVDQKQIILRRLTVAYGIGKLLELPNIKRDHCSIDNFTVQDSPEVLNADNTSSSEVIRVDMIEPSISVRLSTTPFISSGLQVDDHIGVNHGRDVRATIIGATLNSVQRRDEKGLCSALGELLHALFSGRQIRCESETGSNDKMEYKCDNSAMFVQPVKKQYREAFSQYSFMSLNTSATDTISANRHVYQKMSSLKLPPLNECPCPPSILRIIRDLLSCDDELFRSDTSFKCLKEATDEIHLIFEEPNLLFERPLNTHQGKHLLPVSDKLFGRSLEMSKILNAYHRVASTGRSECIIIGADSG